MGGEAIVRPKTAKYTCRGSAFSRLDKQTGPQAQKREVDDDFLVSNDDRMTQQKRLYFNEIGYFIG
jgi:hypothetical protein